jgi:hypothetical protein
MLFAPEYNNREHRYERQIDNVDHLVLHTINDKHNISISMKELYLILGVLYDYRVID